MTNPSGFPQFLPPTPGVNPWQPSTSPWDQSFNAAPTTDGGIVFNSAVPPNTNPIIPILTATNFQVQGATVPAPPTSLWQQTAIQLTMNGANGGTTFTDQKYGTAAASTNGVTTSTAGAATKQFGGSSALCPGTGFPVSGIVFTASSLWDVASNDFTLEGWFNTTQSVQFAMLCSHSTNTFTTGSWYLSINLNTSSDGLLRFTSKEYGGTMLAGTVNHRDGNWHHVAVVRQGNVWSLYCDGTREATVNSNIAIASPGSIDLIFGGSHGITTLNGYLNMWRLVNGAAAYTGAAFQVPTQQFPTS